MTPKPKESQPSAADYGTGAKDWAAHDPRRQAHNRRVVRLIAEKMLPLSLVDSPQFKALIAGFNSGYTLPCRQTLTNVLLPMHTEEVKAKIDALLQQTTSIAITADLWSSRSMRSFLGITGHVIIDYEMISFMFSCIRVTKNHTSVNIAYHYEKAMKDFDVEDKTIDAVTDAGSNMLNAFNIDIPGFETDIYDNESEDDSDDDLPLSRFNDPVSLESHNEDTSDPYEGIPNHHKCYVHTAMRCACDGLKKATDVAAAMKKANSIVKFAGKSCIAAEILEEDKQKKFVKPVKTRWNSQMNSVKSVLQCNKKTLDKIASKMKLKPEKPAAEESPSSDSDSEERTPARTGNKPARGRRPASASHNGASSGDAPARTTKLQQDEREQLTEFCDIMEPLAFATDECQGENLVTASKIIPSVRSLEKHFNDMQLSTVWHVPMVKELQESVKKRLLPYTRIKVCSPVFAAHFNAFVNFPVIK